MFRVRGLNYSPIISTDSIFISSKHCIVARRLSQTINRLQAELQQLQLLICASKDYNSPKVSDCSDNFCAKPIHC